jgi:PAS domain S-box-containing protein
VADFIVIQLALVRTLRGLTATFGSFNDAGFNELDFERRLAAGQVAPITGCWYWTRKLQARFFAGDCGAALDASLNAERLLWTSRFFIETAEVHFYGALSRAACCNVASPVERRQHLEALAVNHKHLMEWAKSCPANFQNRAALVGAEIARLEGREVEAERLYETAIRLARENGFIHDEALAAELAARFYASRGFETIAHTYLQNARHGYLRWGADGKVRQLDQMYPEAKSDEPGPALATTIVAPSEFLDLATVIKVSQAVSGEMVLEKLIDKVLRSAIELAGAERGVLIVPRGDELEVQAEATVYDGAITVYGRGHSNVSTALPHSVVRQVMRTQETVILDDASSKGGLYEDSYFVQYSIRSVLCLPLIHQAKLIGVIYLENNLTPNAFPPNLITVLKVLASQAAVSIENGRLYRELAESESRIRRLVNANIIGIVIWDLDGRILDANEAFLTMLGYSREDLAAGRIRWTDLTPPEWLERDEQQFIPELRKKGTVPPFEKEHFRKDGSRVPILVGVALFEPGGNEGVGFVLDLSKQKQAEAEITALKDHLYRENLALREEVDRASMFEEIVGTSKALKAVLSRVASVAPSDSTVLITGETGTGKELIARAIHKRSHRAERAFVSVNCAALAPSLISSELFGHEKGAFTGALQRRLGRFELADGGTIFLDEVGELLPDTQAALLRVLQEREIERVGSAKPIHIDVRIIAATNRDLRSAAANGTFRQDLYYRLNVFPIEVPPLRERKEDVLMLVEYFVQRYATRAGKNIRSIDKKTLEQLQSYHWPGNIRELQNIIDRSIILSSSDVFSVDESWFPKGHALTASPMPVPQDLRLEFQGKRETIEAALAECRGRVSGPFGAAARLGIPPSTLESRIKALKIRKSSFRRS